MKKGSIHGVNKLTAARCRGWWHKLALLLFSLLALVFSLPSCVGYTPPAPNTPAVTLTNRVPLIPAKTVLPVATSTLPPARTPESALGLGAADILGSEVQFWYPASVDEKGIFPILTKEFNQSNPWGVTVEAIPQESYAVMLEELKQLPPGNLPDALLSYNYQARQLDSSEQMIVELTPYVQDAEWGFSADEVEDFYPMFWNQDVYPQGSASTRRIGVPFYRLVQVIFYNQTWAEELGFADLPTTPERFRTQACAAARSYQAGAASQGGKKGGWAIDTNSSALLGWIYAFGGKVARAASDGYTWNSPEVEEAFTFLRDLYDSSCAWVGESPYPNQEFATRQALFITSSSAGIPYQETVFLDADTPDRWKAISFPSTDGEPVSAAFGPSFSVIRSTPEKQLAAWLYLKWLLEPENQARWTEYYGTFPSRFSVQTHLADYKENHPQWAEVLDLIPYSHSEPGDPSWEAVRLSLSDAGEQLFSPRFSSSRIPDLLEMLEATAAELGEQYK